MIVSCSNISDEVYDEVYKERMRKEKIKLYIAQNKWVKILLFLALGFAGTILLIMVLPNVHIANLSETTKVTIGTLLGAIVGGCFTLIGTLIISSRAQKSLVYVKRKNIIYKPLYDELVLNHNEILSENPYPRHIAFEKEDRSILPFPEYTVWGRIKNDSRLLETPQKLKNAMNSLYAAIEEYMSTRVQAVISLDRVYRDALKVITDERIPEYANVGDTLLTYVLTQSRPEKDTITWGMTVISGEEADLLWHIVCCNCKEDEAIRRFEKAKKAWDGAERITIELLSMYIQYINTKYEG